MKLILGSQSKGRQRVLTRAGFTYTTMPADIDEKAIRHDDLNLLPLLVARAKMAALLPQINEPAIIITADSIAIWHGELREKPESAEQGREFLRSYSGDSVQNITGVVVANTVTGQQFEGVDKASAYFKQLPSDVIEELINEGYVLHCAGSYAIENPLLTPYVERIVGEIETITGLPLTLTKRLLAEAGYAQ
jgi:septum formation protein